MFFDTEHNSVDTVISSLHGAFSETALKMWAYIRCLSTSTQLTATLIISRFMESSATSFLFQVCTKVRRIRYYQKSGRYCFSDPHEQMEEEAIRKVCVRDSQGASYSVSF